MRSSNKTVIEVPPWEELAAEAGICKNWNDLRRSGFFTQGEIAAAWEVPMSTAQQRLNKLVVSGVYVRERAARPTGGLAWLYGRKP